MQQRKFIILFSARSGSNLLVDLLHDHPNIHCDGEVLIDTPACDIRFVPQWQQEKQKTSIAAYGCKVSLYQLGRGRTFNEVRQQLRDLAAEGWQIFYLCRADVVRQSFSFAIASSIGIYHRYSFQQPSSFGSKVRIAPLSLFRSIYDFTYYRFAEERLLRSIPHLSINYEADLSDNEKQQHTVNSICDNLQIKHAEVSSIFVPTSDTMFYKNVMYGFLLYILATMASYVFVPAAWLSEFLHYRYGTVISDALNKLKDIPFRKADRQNVLVRY